MMFYNEFLSQEKTKQFLVALAEEESLSANQPIGENQLVIKQLRKMYNDKHQKF